MVNTTGQESSTSSVTQQELPNGLTVIVEEMPHVESAAYDLLIPGGTVLDPESGIGTALLLAECTGRGAGAFDARAFSDAFDAHGIRHGEGAGFEQFHYSGSLLAGKLPEALRLLGLQVREPIFPAEEVEPVRSLFLQDLRSLRDNPARWAMHEMNARYFPAPYNRPALGTEAGLNAADHRILRSEWARLYRPRGAVLSIAGNVRAADVIDLAGKFFGGWQGDAQALPKIGAFPRHAAHHIEADSAQLQIVVSLPGAKFGEPDYYVAKVANGILSGGMFGRLFIEVREKRGLCYSVHSRHSATLDYGIFTCYAGTTPERAHETLDVMLEVLRGTGSGITTEELARVKANIKTALIIGDESPSSRAGSNASDWWLIRRVRPLQEIQRAIESVSAEDISQYVARRPFTSYMLLTLGSRALRPDN